MNPQALMAEEDALLVPTYGKFPLVLARGEGARVYDQGGRRYLDFYGGHAVAALGHSPKAVVEALSAQAGELLFYSTLAYHPARGRAARALLGLLGVEDGKVFFCNSGAEANEAAMRAARLATGRRTVVSVAGGFHGRTMGALAATGIAKYKKVEAGLGTDCVTVPLGDLEAAAAALKGAAALITEPVQSMAGAPPPPAGWLEGLTALCRREGALLIFDEVQTGLGRLGAPSAAQAFGVTPDVQTFAKAIASGVPCGAAVFSAPVAAALKPGNLGSTFGGGPLACAAAAATLEEITRRRLWENASAMEKLIRRTFTFPGVKAVQGRGLLLGLVLDRPAKAVQTALFEKGVLAGTSEDPAVLRLLPPLTIGEAEVAELRAALADVLAAEAVA
ncbi:MAG: aminotransferase class III-fold pyridoxal phosphate-dependent enzyme [Elusimicrobia bacterium]|nr:aminotransferase class III-fold pyridoxal phosphate-dependent enzyme [Elusimicrobiota bacterium]